MIRMNRKTFFIGLLIFLFFFASMTVKLPYYIYKPGSVDPLSPIVEVEEGTESKGEFHLVTVSAGRASLMDYMIAKLSDYRDLVKVEEAIPKGFTDEAYRYYQLKLMDQSKVASQVVAYEAAKETIKLEAKGVYVLNTVEGMPAEEIIKIGDRIQSVDHIEVEEPAHLIHYVEKKALNDEVTLTVERQGKVKEVRISIAKFPNDPDKTGLGLQLISDQSVKVERDVFIRSGHIGGPSAGLIFALEIYNQLVGEDLTKGYRIAGTGEIDFQGKVTRVGGVDKKVIAAHRKKIDIFFVPYEEGRSDSNYELAMKTAKAIKSDMEIVPVDTFKDALDYLEKLEEKSNPN